MKPLAALVLMALTGWAAAASHGGRYLRADVDPAPADDAASSAEGASSGLVRVSDLVHAATEAFKGSPPRSGSTDATDAPGDTAMEPAEITRLLRDTLRGADGRPWIELSGEERLLRLRSLADRTGGGLAVVTEESLLWLEPVTGRSYIVGLADEVGRLPVRLLDAGPRQLDRTRRLVDEMGGDVAAFDQAMDDLGTRLQRVAERFSDPRWIGAAIE